MTKKDILNLLKEMPEKFSAEELIARIILVAKGESGLEYIRKGRSNSIEEAEEEYGKMESLLINIKTPLEKKALLAFLKSLKMKYTKVNQDQEDKALLKAIEKGKAKGRATRKEQREFESLIKSV